MIAVSLSWPASAIAISRRTSRIAWKSSKRCVPRRQQCRNAARKLGSRGQGEKLDFLKNGELVRKSKLGEGQHGKNNLGPACRCATLAHELLVITVCETDGTSAA